MNMKNKNLFLVVTILFVVLLGTTLNLAGLFPKTETKLLDYRLSLYNKKKASPDIVRLYLDDITNTELPEFKDANNKSMLSRKAWAKVAEFVEKGEPKLVVFNIDFSNYEDSSLSDSSPDVYFSRMLQKYDNIILASKLSKNVPSESDTNTFSPAKYSLDAVIDDKETEKNITYYSSSAVPDIFVQHCEIAVSNIVKSPNVVRYSKPLYKLTKNGRVYYIPSVPFAILLKSIGFDFEGNQVIIKNGKLLFSDRTMPIDKNGEIFINLPGDNKFYQTFPVVQILNAISKYSDTFESNGTSYGADTFKDKIVIIERSYLNQEMMRVANGEKLSEGDVNAVIADGYINDSNAGNPAASKFLTPATKSLSVALAFVFCYLILIFNLRFKRPILSFLLIFAYAALNVLLFVAPQVRMWFPLVFPVYYMLATWGVTLFLTINMKQQKREEIVGIFKNHVSKLVMQELLKKPDSISLKPEKKYVSIMYCDIKDFTNLSNVIPAELLVVRLNEIMEIIVNVVFENNGTISKFSNDSAVVYWGDPISTGNDALEAVRAALEIQRRIAKLNHHYNLNNQVSLDLKIAINTGEALIGYIGPKTFADYTLIGDTLSNTLKIEQICSQFGKQILISESTYNFVKDFIETTYAGALSVKGKQNKIGLYEPVSPVETE